jgi:hypothetical protein
MRKSLVQSGSAQKLASLIGNYLVYNIDEINLVVIGKLIALHLPARKAAAEQTGTNI